MSASFPSLLRLYLPFAYTGTEERWKTVKSWEHSSHEWTRGGWWPSGFEFGGYSNTLYVCTKLESEGPGNEARRMLKFCQDYHFVYCYWLLVRYHTTLCNSRSYLISMLKSQTILSYEGLSTHSGLTHQTLHEFTAVLCRNWRLFCRVFWSHRCLRSDVSLNFH